nr:reverse transcriptase domain-containing protein [Tanacetum cinerariifolium]
MEGKWIMKKEMRMISKARHLRKKNRKKKRKMRKNRRKNRKRNTSDNEVESDLESVARSKPKCKEMADACESGIRPKLDSSKVVHAYIANANGGNGGNRNGGNNECSYNGFLDCNPRDYDGKGGAVALTRWIEKMEPVIENSGCTKNQKVKSSKKRKEMEETSKQGGSWKDNKKARVGKGFVATAPPRNENVG